MIELQGGEDNDETRNKVFDSKLTSLQEGSGIYVTFYVLRTMVHFRLDLFGVHVQMTCHAYDIFGMKGESAVRVSLGRRYENSIFVEFQN